MKNLIYFIGLNKATAVDATPSGGASVISTTSVVEMETETHTTGMGMGMPQEHKISEEVRLKLVYNIHVALYSLIYCACSRYHVGSAWTIVCL